MILITATVIFNTTHGLLTKTQTRPWVGFLAGTHGLGRALASSSLGMGTSFPFQLHSLFNLRFPRLRSPSFGEKGVETVTLEM